MKKLFILTLLITCCSQSPQAPTNKIVVEKWRSLGYIEYYTDSHNTTFTITKPTQYYIDVLESNGSITTITVTESIWDSVEL